jgi:hypothetical protein
MVKIALTAIKLLNETPHPPSGCAHITSDKAEYVNEHK